MPDGEIRPVFGKPQDNIQEVQRTQIPEIQHVQETQMNTAQVRQYNEEDVKVMLDESARRGAAEALKNVPSDRLRQGTVGDVDDDNLVGVSPKLVKQLQATVGVFNTLKEFASNPLQKAIESKVGELAAGVIETAFTRQPASQGKKDLIETILNSQFAFGLGNGLGQRGPELVESMGRTFGPQRAGDMVDGILGKYGKTQGGQGVQPSGGGQLNPGPGSSPSGPAPEQKQSEKELLMSLDPNNPEHVAAYAETQGGLSVDVARKMLIIHQDEFIKQMAKQGIDASKIPKIPPRTGQVPGVPGGQVPGGPSPGVEAFEVSDVPKGDTQYPHDPVPNSHNDQQDNTVDGARLGQFPTDSHNQQPEAITQFANDIGKIMGDMVSKIETLNNEMFLLKGELIEMKRKGVSTTYIDDQHQQIVNPDEVESPLDIIGLPSRDQLQLGTVAGLPATPAVADNENTHDDTQWRDDPSIGILSKERREEEEIMRRTPIYDTAAESVRSALENRKRANELVSGISRTKKVDVSAEFVKAELEVATAKAVNRDKVNKAKVSVATMDATKLDDTKNVSVQQEQIPHEDLSHNNRDHSEDSNRLKDSDQLQLGTVYTGTVTVNTDLHSREGLPANLSHNNFSMPVAKKGLKPVMGPRIDDLPEKVDDKKVGEDIIAGLPTKPTVAGLPEICLESAPAEVGDDIVSGLPTEVEDDIVSVPKVEDSRDGTDLHSREGLTMSDLSIGSPANIKKDISRIKKCPKCKKIKPLIETEKGPMCSECRIERGL